MECLSEEDDEISVSIESGGNEITVMEESTFYANTVKEINKSFMCIDFATVFIKEHDKLGDDRASSRITCSEMSYYFEFEMNSYNCWFINTPIKYRIYFDIKEIERDAYVQVKFLYNINQPSEWTSEVDDDFISGDEFNIVVSYDQLDLSYNVPYDRQSNRWIKSKRNSVIRFFYLSLPCNGLKLRLKEKDQLDSLATDSNTVSFDCDRIGVAENLFWIGNDPSRGKYRMITNIVDKYVEDFDGNLTGTNETSYIENYESFEEDHRVFSPVDTPYNSLGSRQMRIQGTRAMKFKTLMNVFNTNDIIGQDELSISIMSDLVGSMFKCGKFKFSAGDLIDFDDLIVPCDELVTVTLTELDGYQDDGHTVLIPCKANSQ